MAIHRLNHAVLYVGHLDTTVAFYTEVLGFVVVQGIPGQAAFLQAPDSTNDHDLGLFQLAGPAGPSPAGRSSVGLYHLAWEVGTLGDLEELQAALSGAGALTGRSDHGTTKSLYGVDPDGSEFEVVWLVPAHRLDGAAAMTLRPLDLDTEIARYGRDTRGGLGISVPLGVQV